MHKLIMEYLEKGDLTLAVAMALVALLFYVKRIHDFSYSLRWKRMKNCRSNIESGFLTEQLKKATVDEFNILSFHQTHGIWTYNSQQLMTYIKFIEKYKNGCGRVLIRRAGYAIKYENGSIKTNSGKAEIFMKWFSLVSMIFMFVAFIVAIYIFIDSIYELKEANWKMLIYSLSSGFVAIVYLGINLKVNAVLQIKKHLEDAPTITKTSTELRLRKAMG